MTGPISPCGLTVDMLRVCYDAEMVFEPGGPRVPIRWFQVPDDRPGLGFYNRFSSRNFGGREGSPDGLGEVPQLRRRGHPSRPPFPYSGGAPDGPLACWQATAPGPFPDLPLSPDGSIAGCPQAMTGALGGGKAIQEWGRFLVAGRTGGVGGGAGIHPQTVAMRAAGGARANGAAEIALGVAYDALGGALAGGEAVWTYKGAWLARGGARAGGAALGSVSEAQVAQGGAVAGGAAAVGGKYTMGASRGALGGGAATLRPGAQLTAGGGGVAGGAAQQLAQVLVGAAGGARGGGAAVQLGEAVLAATGGAVLGGAAAIAGPLVSAGGGGVAGGAALVPTVGQVLVGQGGARAGGAGSFVEGEPMPRGHIDGYILSNVSGASLQVASGAARDGLNQADINFSGPWTKGLLTPWSAGNGGGGSWPPAPAANGWADVYAIWGASAGTDFLAVAGGSTFGSLPSGFTNKRILGSVCFDASGNIYQFSQCGDEFLWLTPFQDVNGTFSGTAAQVYTLHVPIGRRVWALLRTVYASNQFLLSALDETDTAPSGYLMTAENSFLDRLRVRTNAGGQVRLRIAAAPTTVQVATGGWIDPRGRDQ